MHYHPLYYGDMPNYLTVIQFQGDNIAKFLQGQLTCDVAQLSPDKPQLAAHCNAKGRVISLFDIFISDEQYYLCLPTALADIAIENLTKYARFSKITVSLMTDAEKQATLLARGYPTALPIDIDSWRLERIRANTPSLFPVTSTCFLPHSLNLPELNAVSFSKGCYTGQEIIARMQHLGAVKQRLYYQRLQTEVCPVAGEALFVSANAQQVAGWVVDAVNIDGRVEATLSLKTSALDCGALFRESGEKIILIEKTR